MFRSIKKSITIGEITTIIAVIGSFIVSYYSNKNSKEIALLQSREQYNLEMIKHKEQVIRDASELFGYNTLSYLNQYVLNIRQDYESQQVKMYESIPLKAPIKDLENGSFKILDTILSNVRDNKDYSAKLYTAVSLSKLYFGPKTNNAANELLYEYQRESYIHDKTISNYISAMRDEESYGLKDTSKLDNF